MTFGGVTKKAMLGVWSGSLALAMFHFWNTQSITTRSLLAKTPMSAYRHLQRGILLGFLLRRVTVASSAASAILNWSERRVDAVQSDSLRCAGEFK